MFPEIVQVLPTDDFTVYVYFEDGKIVCYDMKKQLSKEVFRVLNNITIFKNTCTILNDTLAWDLSGKRDSTKALDIAPDMLYDLPAVNDILQ